MKFLTSLLLLFTCFIEAQNPWDQIKKMNETYDKLSSYSMNVSVSIYEKNTASNSAMTYKGSMKKSANGYYSSLMKRTTINNKSAFIVVDENTKKILYGKPLKEEPHSPSQAVAHDSLKRAYTAKLVPGNAEKSIIELLPKQGSIYKKIVVVINSGTNILEKIEYYYSSNAEANYEKIVINYSNTKLNVPISESDFSETKYVQVSKKNCVPAVMYKSYEVIDTRNIDLSFE